MKITIELTDGDLQLLAGDINECGPGGEDAASVARWIESNPSSIKSYVYDGVLEFLSED